MNLLTGLLGDFCYDHLLPLYLDGERDRLLKKENLTIRERLELLKRNIAEWVVNFVSDQVANYDPGYSDEWEEEDDWLEDAIAQALANEKDNWKSKTTFELYKEMRSKE